MEEQPMQNKRSPCWTRILQLLACVLLSNYAQARADILVNFDGLSDNDIVTNQFAGLIFSNAIILTAGISLNEFEFPPHSDLNVISDNGGPISILFASPVLSFGGYFTYSLPLTLTAFDAGSSQVGQAVALFNNNLMLSGDPGSNPNEFLSIAFAAGISSVTITGDPAGGSFTLDDAIYQPSVAAVPEPTYGALLLLIIGFLALPALRRNFQHL